MLSRTLTSFLAIFGTSWPRVQHVWRPLCPRHGYRLLRQEPLGTDSCLPIYACNSPLKVTQLLMALAGLCMYGPQTMMGLFAMEMVPSHRSSLAASIVGVCSQVHITCCILVTTFMVAGLQVGSSFAGYPVSIIKQSYGWDSLFVLMASAGIAWALAMVPTWSIGEQDKDKKEK